MSDSMTAGVVRVSGHQGDQIEAYLAQPSDAPSRGGVVVIHHFPAWDRQTKEITRRFAALGYDAICPNLYSRDAPGTSPADILSAGGVTTGVPDAQATGDIAGSAAYLRSLPASNGKVATIGYCSGGRQSVLAASSVPLEAAIDCYGGFVTSNSPPQSPLQSQNIVEELPALGTPLLGLFGNEDAQPSPAHVDELEAILLAHGKEYEFHRYDGAGHAFFAVDRPAYRPEAAVDGWLRIAEFLQRHLATEPPQKAE
jgi:carboxymethylenebutenolidase